MWDFGSIRGRTYGCVSARMPHGSDTLQLGSISPEASLMDIDTVDPYRSLYFSLCY